MAWLSGWSKRVKITIDAGDIDADLTHFPVLVHISASCGINSEDLSCVFDELTSDANRKKIAVTKADGTTELYVEIEKWDDANEQAWLWVSKSDWVIDDAVNTDLYLYYDADHANNTDYVGDIDSTPGAAVWDSNFKAVHHLRDATTSTVKDSTSNNNDGTKVAANEPIEYSAGKIGPAQNFDGTNDGIVLPDFDVANLTVECWVNMDVVANYKSFITQDYDATNRAYDLCLDTSTLIFFVWTPSGIGYRAGSTTITAGTYRYFVGTYDGTTIKVYVAGAEQTYRLSVTTSGNLNNTTIPVSIGYKPTVPATCFVDGKEDEVRISNIARSAAWIKATYETTRDNLLDWGSEEEAFSVTTASSLTASTSITRKRGYPRAVKPSLTASSSVGRLTKWIRDTNSTLSLSAAIRRIWDGVKMTVPTGLTAATSVTKSFGKKVATAASLTVGTTIGRLTKWARAIVSGLQAAIGILYRPKAITQPPSLITASTARLNGKIKWDGGETCEARFRWRPSGTSLYEYYNEGNDDYANFYDVYWGTHTFTPIIAHVITSVKLALYRSGSPSTITVSIRATDGDGKPTGEDLCFGTTNGNTLPTSPSYEWREITLGDGYSLSESTKYAIVIRAISGNAFNRFFWLLDGSSPTYAGGSYGISYDSGVTWELDALDDIMFEEWGESIWTTTNWQNTLETNDTYYEDLAGLTAGTEYEFQAQAKNTSGEGQWSASRNFWAAFVTASLLGASASITRTVDWARASSSSLTLATTIIKSWGRSIVTSCGLTLSTTIGRLAKWTRDTTSGLTAGATISRLAKWIRTSASGLTAGVSITASAITNYIITLVTSLSASVTITRTLDWARAVSSGLTAATSITRSRGRTIAISVGLTISTTIGRLVEWTRSVVPGLTGASSVSRKFESTRASVSSLTAATSITRTSKWQRVTSVGLTITTSISRLAEWIRTTASNLSASISITATAELITHYLITTATNLSVAVSQTRKWAIKRAISSSVTASVSVSRLVKFIRAIPNNLTLSASINRAVAYVRDSTAGLVVSTSINRLAKFIRATASQVLASASVIVGGVVNYVITLATNLTAGVSVSRLFKINRDISVNLNAQATINRLFKAIRTIGTVLILSVTLSKIYGWVKTTSANLAASVTIKRTLGWFREIPAGVSAAVSILLGGVSNYLIQLSTNLNAAVSITRRWAITRATSSNLQLIVTLVRNIGMTIATSVGLTITSSINRTVEWFRKITSSLTVAVSISKPAGFIRTISGNLDISVSVKRTVEWFREIPTNIDLGLSIIVNGITNTIIAIGANLSVVVSIARTVGWTRVIPSALDVIGAIIRNTEFYRTTTANLTIGLSIIYKQWWCKPLRMVVDRMQERRMEQARIARCRRIEK